MIRITISFLIMTILGIAGFWSLTSPALFDLVRGDGLHAAAKPARDLDNGRALFAAGGCASCHMSPDQNDRTRLGGGIVLKTEFGLFYPPNISPDPQDGIGGWSETDFIRAMRDGISPSGQHYYPSFPYTSYRHMTPDDVADLFAFLKTLPAIGGTSRDHDLSFPYSVRRGLGVWKLAFLDADMLPSTGTMLDRGRYLVEGPGHCAECHSPRNLAGAIRKDLKFSGASDPEGTGWVSNITPHERGIGSWSREDIAELLRSGFTPEYDAVGGSMADVVKNTSQISDSDRLAMADYLKSLLPLAGIERPKRPEQP